MGISLLSISHQNAPLAVRELFAFPEHVQEDLMKQMLERGFAAECVIISTCNRTEVYTFSEREESIAERVKEAGIKKTALTVVGDFLGDEYELSKLYDRTFTTEFRKGVTE